MALVFALSFGLASGQVSDTTPPQITGFSFSPATIDVTTDPQTVTLSMNVTDDLSGVAGIAAAFMSAGGQYRSPWEFTPVEGGPLDGRWEGQVTFAPFSESGVWNVVDVFVYDVAGNPAFIDPATLPMNQLTVISVSDTSPPAITPGSMILSPASVDVTAGAQEFSLTLAVTDDLSGVEEIFVTFQAPTIPQHTAFLGQVPAEPVSGDLLNGIYCLTGSVPPHVESGEWAISEIWLRDKAGNQAFLYSCDIAGLEPPVLTVTSGPPDFEPPVLRSASLSPRYLDATREPVEERMVTVRVELEDAGSGVAGIFILMYESPSGAQWAGFAMGGPQLVSGTPDHGIWEGSFPINRYAEAGTWRLHALHFHDTAGNWTVMNAPELDASDVPTDALIVGLPSLAVDGTVWDPAAGAVIVDQVFGERASLTIPAGALSQPTTVALDVFDTPLDLGIPSGFKAAATLYVNVQLDPEPPMPFAAPGITVVLPLVQTLAPGAGLDLFRVDRVTGELMPALGVNGLPVKGTVNPGGLSATFEGVAHLSLLVGLSPDVVEVLIDIKPGSSINAVNLGSNGLLPVAILSSDAFDARTVDPLSVTLAGAGVRLTPQGAPMAGFEDVNNDGLGDMVVHVRVDQLQLQLTAGETELALEGATFAGVGIHGTDMIRVVD